MRVAPTSRVSPVPELFGVDTEPSAPPRSRITTSTTKASFVLLMMAWLTSVVAFFSSGWIVLEGSVVFKQGGEQHDVNLSLGLWRVTYAASRRVRGNVVGEVDSTSSLCGQKRELAPGTEVVQGTWSASAAATWWRGSFQRWSEALGQRSVAPLTTRRQQEARISMAQP